MTYDELLMAADAAGLIVKEAKLLSGDGRCKGHRIAIRQDIQTTAEKADVLAEEMGHYYTGVGRIIEQGNASDRKQELAARKWAYNKRIGLDGIIRGYHKHCQSKHDLVDCLEVSEETLKAALEFYRSKYGCSVEYNEYIIFFEPSLTVMNKDSSNINANS